MKLKETYKEQLVKFLKAQSSRTVPKSSCPKIHLDDFIEPSTESITELIVEFGSSTN